MGYDLTGSYDEHAEPATGYEPLPANTYRARIIEAEIEDISKSEPYGRELKLTWQVETGPYEGRLVWQRLKMWAERMNNVDQVVAIANREFAAIRHAIGKTAITNTDELLQIPCDIYVGLRTKEGRNPQNEVRSVKPAGNPVQQSAQQRAPAAPRQSAPPQQQRSAPAAGNGKAAPWRQTA